MMQSNAHTMDTSGIGGGSSSSKKEKKSVAQRINGINEMETPKLLRNMRIVNIFLCLIQILAGFVGLTSFITLNITGSLISIYVILFGLLFLVYECRLNRMEKKIRSNFGFLYSYKGRTSFIFFIGFLNFGMGTAFGYIAGFLMCGNALINLMVLCRHPEFKEGGTLGANSDPTSGYTTGNQEAATYMKNNPQLAVAAINQYNKS